MTRITVQGRKFNPFISAQKIQERVTQMAEQINHDYPDDDLQIIGVLTGCFRFMADLTSQIKSNCCITSMKIKSYYGTKQRNSVKKTVDIDIDIKGKHVLIVEDIIDSGYTMEYFLNDLAKREPKSISVAALCLKPDAVKKDINAKYVGFEIPNAFVIGYGLDVDGYGRNLSDIWQLDE